MKIFNLTRNIKINKKCIKISIDLLSSDEYPNFKPVTVTICIIRDELETFCL